MALILNDRVKETSTSSGLNDFALAGAMTGFQSFAHGVGNNNTTYYCAEDGNDWEVGIGTLSSDSLTLARTTILQSSNLDAKVNFASGTKTIFVTYPASKAIHAGNLPTKLFIKDRSASNVQINLVNGYLPVLNHSGSSINVSVS